MAETKKSVDVYKVSYVCDKCGVGSMEPSGVMKTTNPPKYEHVCNNCGYRMNFYEEYPAIRYEED